MARVLVLAKVNSDHVTEMAATPLNRQLKTLSLTQHCGFYGTVTLWYPTVNSKWDVIVSFVLGTPNNPQASMCRVVQTVLRYLNLLDVDHKCDKRTDRGNCDSNSGVTYAVHLNNCRCRLPLLFLWGHVRYALRRDRAQLRTCSFVYSAQ